MSDTATQSAAVSAAEARALGRTVLGPTIVVDGEVEGEAEVVVHGTVIGKLSAARVVVAPEGVVDADVRGASVQVSGKVEGSVTATERAELASTAKVTGEIRAPRILIADGAQFKGNVDMG